MASDTTKTAAELFKKSLDTFLAKDMKGWLDMCDENVVAEFPYAPENMPARLEGRDAVFAHIGHFPELIDIQELTSSRIFQTDDPNVAAAEWTFSGRVIGNGNPFNMPYAAFITFKDGLLVHYREYWNPLVALKAMGVM